MVCSTCSVAFQHTEAKPTATIRDTCEHTDRGGTVHTVAYNCKESHGVRQEVMLHARQAEEAVFIQQADQEETQRKITVSLTCLLRSLLDLHQNSNPGFSTPNRTV